MLDLSNVELQKSTRPPIRPERDSMRSWIVAAVAVIVVAAAAAWFSVAWRARSQPATTAAAAPAAEPAAPTPAPAAVEPIVLPPLAETDPLVRQMVAALSAHPTVARWLATNGLIRNVVVVVENIAYGAQPARHLPALRPPGSFRTIAGEDELTIDPRGYQRFAPIAAAVDSIDAQGAARLYRSLQPRIEDAYAELGRSEPFDAALERALVVLLRTPALEGRVPVVPKGIGFAFEDPRVERLSPAQKQLARMGPVHVRIIQRKLRAIAAALAIPPERLP
jgi:hypothetical protein